jgi:putative addiction module CopG family antidote
VRYFYGVMATKTLKVSLTRQLNGSIERRVRSGLYGDASDVVRAGLRALAREEMAAANHEWHEIAAKLPQEPITRKIEQRVERAIRAEREAERKASAHK